MNRLDKQPPQQDADGEDYPSHLKRVALHLHFSMKNLYDIHNCIRRPSLSFKEQTEVGFKYSGPTAECGHYGCRIVHNNMQYSRWGALFPKLIGTFELRHRDLIATQ